MSSPFTIFGGHGFIGSEIARQLRASGENVSCIGRGDWPADGSFLGQVIYAIGMTADFRSRLTETMELQVLRLHEAMTRYRHTSFLMLSSTRVYDGATATAEDTPLLVRPALADHVYNISKLAGESLCLASANPAVRVVRLSNVYGAQDASNLFMTAVLRDAVTTGHVTIGQAPTSAKDYIAVEDAARHIVAIARSGRDKLYNIACGENFSHSRIATLLESEGFSVTFRAGGPEVTFPPINVTRLRNEFGIVPATPDRTLPAVIQALKAGRTTP